METQDRSILTNQDRTTGGRGYGRDCDDGHSGGRVKEVIYCYYCKESGHTKYNCSLLQGKQQSFRSANVSTSQETSQEEQSDSNSCVSEKQMKEHLYQHFRHHPLYFLTQPLWPRYRCLSHDERIPERRNVGFRTKCHPGSCCSSSQKESSWILVGIYYEAAS